MEILKIIFSTLIIITFCSSLNNNNHKNEADFNNLTKLILRFDNVHKIDLYTCWTAETLVKFTKVIKLPTKQLYGKLKLKQKLNEKTTIDNIDKQVVYVLDLTCNNSMKMLLHANQTLMFKAPSKWIIIIENISEFPAGLNIFLDSRVNILQKENNVIYSIYRNRNFQYYTYQVVGVVENGELEAYKSVLDYSDRKNLEKTDVNVGFVILSGNTTIEELVEFRNLEKNVYAKFHIHLKLALMDILNSTMAQHYTNSYGRFIENTTKYNGVLGLFQNDVIDIASACVYIHPARSSIIGVTLKYNGIGRLVFRSPPLSKVKNILRLPLQDNVWFGIFLLLILQFFLIFAIVRWEWSKKVELELESKSNVLRPRLLDIAQIQVGALFQQGSEAEPKSTSGHVISFTLFLSFLFFYTAYSACIVALLQSTANNINTLDDMVNSDINVRIDKMSYMAFIIEEAKSSQSAINFYNTKIAPNGAPHDVNYVPLQKAITSCVRDDFCALFGDEDRLYKEINRVFTEAEKCGLKAVPLTAESYPYVPYRKGSTYTELFRVGLALMKDVGIHNRVDKRLLATAPQCKNAGGIFRSVSLVDCYFALLTFSFGIIITFLVFTMEIIYHKYESRNNFA